MEDKDKSVAIDADENVRTIYRKVIDSETDGYVLDLAVSDKRFYATNCFNKQSRSDIIDLKDINYVELINTKSKSRICMAFLSGMFVFIVGLAWLFMTLLFKYGVFSIVLSSVIMPAGVIINVIGVHIGLPKRQEFLILGTCGGPVEFLLRDTESEKAEAIRREIIKAKDGII